MWVVGLTGSIGMGKTTAADMLRRLGIPVFDADAAVRALESKGGAAVPAIARAFPGLVREGALDREGLARRAFENPADLHKLEAIVHPFVHVAEAAFLRAARVRRAGIAVLEIPLLFESGAERRCDVTLVVTAPRFVQAARVLKRPGMTGARFRAILARQMPDAEKRARADFVVSTGMGRYPTLKALGKIVRLLRQSKPR